MVKKSAARKIYFNKLWLAVIVLALLQAATWYHLANIARSVKSHDDFVANSLVNTAEARRYQQPALSVSENRAYMPELRVFVPLDAATMDLRYDVREVNGATDNFYLSLSGVIGRQTEADDATCDKMVRVSKTAEPDSSEQLAAEISPAQNGFRYIFRHSDCQIYADGSMDKLVEAARSIRQY